MSNVRWARIAALVATSLAAATFGAPAMAVNQPDLPEQAVVAPAKQSHPPKPTPVPIPTAQPTAVPTPVATAAPTSRPTAAPTAVPTPTLRPTGTPVPTRAPTPKPTPAATPQPTKAPARGTPRPSQAATAPNTHAAAASTQDVAAGILGDPAASSELIPEPQAGGPGIVVLAIGLVGFGGVFVVLFGRGRRNTSRAGDLVTVPASDPAPARTSLPPSTPSGEANVPRWLRASVRNERFWTPSSEPTTRTTRHRAATFDEPIGDGAIRMVVRYDNVDVLDQTNEAYAHKLGEVGTGDEVEIVELADAWALVRTPRGVTGWLPTMTVGAALAAPEPPEVPAAPDEVDRPARKRTTRRRRAT
jgi:hypothetical protein